MKRKFLCLILALAILSGIFAGCDTIGETVGEIADNVANAAKAELEKQVRAVFEEYKVDMVELKTAAGKLNDGEGKFQFFCAVLVRAENDALPQACAKALANPFQDSGVVLQTGSAIASPYLVKKDLSYKFTGFDDGSTYYTVYVYSAVDPQAILDSVK